MKLYYYPNLLFFDRICLYTEAEKAKLSEIEQNSLAELDEDAIARIGEKPCVLRKVLPLDQRIKNVENLRSRVQEFFE